MDPWLNIIVHTMANELDREARWWAFAKAEEKHEQTFMKMLEGLFAAQRREVLRRVNANPPGKGTKAPGDEWLFDPAVWEPEFEKSGKPLILGAVKAGGEQALKDLGLAINFSITHPAVQEFIAKKVPKFAFDVNNTTLNQLRAEFKAALDAGEGIPQITKRVEKIFGFPEKFRNKRIAQTEMVGVINKGGHEGMVQSGVVKEKEWITTMDGLARDTHDKMDGQHVALEKRYSNGLMHPGDYTGKASEIINCRCTDAAYSFI